MKRAMFIKRVKIGAGDALLYKLSDPINETTNVVISAVSSSIGGERATIFPSTDKGVITSFKSLAEAKNTLDHEAPLVNLGYEVM